MVMHALYYWRPDNYRRDLDYGAGYHLNQSSPRLHDIAIGESLWAFTRNKSNRYVLAAELVVKARTFNARGFRYGEYRVWGDLDRSRYFETEHQPSIEQVIRALSTTSRAQLLAQSFQGRSAVKALTDADHRILLASAATLATEPRARILPEDRLEAALLLGDREAVEELVRDERPGVAESRQQYLYTAAPTRSRELARELQAMYAGRCQICLWDPHDQYGRALCQSHHIHWLSRGGADDLDNLMLVCPNHHIAIHSCDAPFDFRAAEFAFPIRIEPLRLNRHLPTWSLAA